MSKDFLKVLFQTILEVLRTKIPAWAYPFLKEFLDKALATAEVTAVAAAAPDALKAWVKGFLLAQIDERVPFIVLRAVLGRLVKALDGAILDFVWDLAMDKLNGTNAARPMVAFANDDEFGLNDIAAAHAA